ncbi:hypothetical protein [Kushneria phyllosphaerae]|uniref:hypothetical protein n=1 Tax=Kushneria phyllosphaerae TaxID=2100822 RepID=UPI001402157E|nr:hypothetical protein [Kushneria phyllosphaerae]
MEASTLQKYFSHCLQLYRCTLELIEKKYRDTPRKNKKYIKRLRDLINALLAKERYIEANYFFKELHTLKPDHVYTLKTGYELSIRTFSKKEASIYEEKLISLNYPELEIIWYRLQLFFALNYKEGAESCCEYILSNKVGNERLSFILESCIKFKSEPIAFYFSRHLRKNKLDLKSANQKSEIKKLLIPRLIKALPYQNDQLLNH